MISRFIAFAFCGFVLVGSIRAQDASVPAEGVDWKPFNEAIELAAEQKKKVLVDIYAAWCPWCRRLQREVYVEESVQRRLEDDFIVTRLDGENQVDSVRFREFTLTQSELALGFGTQGYPNTVFLDSDGQYITRLPGFVDAAEFTKVLAYVGSDAFKELSYPEYLESIQP